MKKLDISAIASGISMYIKGGTLEFLQLAHQEAIAELMTSRIGASYDAAKGYILNGCINSGSGSNYIISAGSIFYNGEVYLVDAATFTISGSNVAVGVLNITQYTTDADPTDFTDAIQRNVHNIRKIKFQAGLSGSGLFDFVDAVNLAYRPVGAIGQTVEWYMPGASSQNSQLATYFDSGTLNGIHPLTLGWKIDDVGLFTLAYKAGDADAGTIGDTTSIKTVTLNADNIPALKTDNDFAGSAGTGVSAYAKSAAGSLSQEDVNFGSANTPVNIIPLHKVKLKITRYE